MKLVVELFYGTILLQDKLVFCILDNKLKKVDIQTRKLEFIQKFLQVQNVDVIYRLEKILQKESQPSDTVEFKSITIDEFNTRIDQSMKDSKEGRLIEASDLKKRNKRVDLKILWTEFSRKELNKIFKYYQKNESFEIAKSLIKEIYNATLILKNQPKIGSV